MRDQGEGSEVYPGNSRAVVATWILTRGLLLLTLLWVKVVDHRPIGLSLSSWDVGHFIRISRQGYAQRTEVAFFPGMPLLMRWGANLHVAPWLTGFILAVICSALAAAALHRLGGPLVACLWLLAPMTVFTFVPYTEAPFAAAAFWAWERARKGHWWQAALCAAAGSCFRISGIFLVGALVVLALLTPGRRAPRLVCLVLPALVTAAYFTYLHHLTGDWMAWSHEQAIGWRRNGFHTPMYAFGKTWMAAHRHYWPRTEPWVHLIFRAEIVAVGFGTLVTLYCLARRRWAEASFVAVQVFVYATSYWWMSSVRGVLLWFPGFVMLAEWAAWSPRNRQLRAVWRGVWFVAAAFSCVVLVLWGWLFFNRQWAG